MSASWTVTFFFTNLRLGLGLSEASAVTGSVTAATTTVRRALTAVRPLAAPKRAWSGSGWIGIER